MKKYSFIILTALGLLAGGGVLAANVWGYAWSDNVGWISFNCNDRSSVNQCATSNYGITINTTTDPGLMTGYAWSDNIGWISFNKKDLAGCPVGTCEARIDLNQASPNYLQVSGWAKPLLSRSEYYNSTVQKDDDSTTGIGGVYKEAQIFTVGAIGPNLNFYPNKVKVKVYQTNIGSHDNTVNAYIETIDASNHPTGVVRCQGSVDGSTFPLGNPSTTAEWREIGLSCSSPLSAGATYALVLSAPSYAHTLWDKIMWVSSCLREGGYCTPDPNPPEADPTPLSNDCQAENFPGVWTEFDSKCKFELYGSSAGAEPASKYENNWIQLNPGTAGTEKVHLVGNEFHGWGFGGGANDNEAIIGWMSFNHATDGSGVEYKVMTDLNGASAPSASNLNMANGDYCSSPGAPPVFLNWAFSDPNGETQASYRLQVDVNSSFASPIFDSGSVNSASNTNAPLGLSFGTSYYWRLDVWNTSGLDSGWVNGSNFTTQNRYPNPQFTWLPSSPSVSEAVNFTNNTSNCSSCSYLWNFGDGDATRSTNPTHTFTSPGPFTVSLSSTNGSGNSCSSTQTLNPVLQLPKWREISPNWNQ